MHSLWLTCQEDAHYWTHQYGSKGLLLNGAVIASTEDETAVFYNPGAMGNGEDFGVSLSFFTPSYSILKTSNYLGTGTSVRDTRFGFTPGFAAVGYRFGRNNKLRAAFTSFTRFKSGLGYRDREVGTVRNDPDLIFIGNLDFSRRVSQRWVGYGMAYRFSDQFSIGATQFAVFHSENASLSVQKEIVHQSNPFSVLLGWRRLFKYSYGIKGGLLTKIGISATLDNVKIGLVVTTPTYHHFFGSASYEYDDLKTYGQDSTILLSNLSSATLQDYQTPWSIGFGLDFSINRSRVSISTEYFQKTPTYTVIDETDDPFNQLIADANAPPVVVRAGNKQVLNLAVGCQTKFNDKTTLIWGFRTDFNQRILDRDQPTLSFLSTTPNIFHVSCGGLFTVWNNQFSLGLDYAFGRKQTNTRLVDLAEISESNIFEFSQSGNVTSSYQSFLLILTYDFIVKSWKERRKRIKAQRALEGK